MASAKYSTTKEKYDVKTEKSSGQENLQDSAGLPSNLRLSAIDEYGFLRPSNFDYKMYENFMSEYLSILARRSRKWENLVKNKQLVSRNRKVKRFIRKGIPNSLRGKIWLSVSGAEAKRQEHPGYYEYLLQEPKNEELLETITLDLNRTFPDNVNFQGSNCKNLQSLSNVLGAFGLHNPSIGYCQGLNYITGLLLIIVDNEESAFWLLTVMMEDILPGYHTQDMTGALTDIYILGQIIREKKPLIWKHLEFNKLELSLVVTKWLICLFVEVLPVETVLRIWDCLFYEGNKIVIRISVALILSNEKEIFMSHDFPALIECFKNMAKNEKVLNCHHFLEDVFRMTGPMPRASIQKLRDEAREIVLAERKELEDRRKNRRQEAG